MKNHDFSDSAWREAMDTTVLAAEMHKQKCLNQAAVCHRKQKTNLYYE